MSSTNQIIKIKKKIDFKFKIYLRSITMFLLKKFIDSK